MKKLEKIRAPQAAQPLKRRILISIGIAVFGCLLGVFQKYIDGNAQLPQIFYTLDTANYFGRLGVWILLGTILSVYASAPVRAAVNTFLFFISMITGYYLYCNFISGFLPTSYMMIWIVLSFATPLFAYICWYAKGKGIASVTISAVILGVSFSQAFLITQGFYVTHITEVITWAAVLFILRRKPKELLAETAASVVAALIYQIAVPYRL